MTTYLMIASVSTDQLGGIAGWATDMMTDLGAVGAGIAIAAENLFPPIPSEAILPLAGFFAARGEISLAAVLVATTIGSVVGAGVLYLCGRVLGRRRLLGIVERVPLMRVGDVERSEAWFARHGDLAVLLGRMIPIVRSLISVPAGVTAMPIGRFLVLTAVGSAAWNTVFVMAGYALGEHWDSVQKYASALQTVVVATAALAVAVFVVMRVRQYAIRGR